MTKMAAKITIRYEKVSEKSWQNDDLTISRPSQTNKVGIEHTCIKDEDDCLTEGYELAYACSVKHIIVLEQSLF